MRTTEWIVDSRNSLINEVTRCWPWLESAMRRGIPGGVVTHHLEDVIQLVLSGDAQLWSTSDGCMLTYITSYPRCRILEVWCLAGDFDQVSAAHEQSMVDFAKSIGAVLLHVRGRKGWAKKLQSRGYKQGQVIMTLNLMEQEDGNDSRGRETVQHITAAGRG